jgi:NADPH-dependent curcumin reductase
MINRQVVLASRPKGVAQAEHFAIRDAPVAAPAEGQIRVRNEFLSVEPAMRGWIADRGNYSAAVEIGSAMRALAVGEIVESRHPDYRPGEIVTGWFGWQETATVDATAVVRRVAETDLPRSLALGVLGINGVSALVGPTAIGEPQPGETVLVSTAAGAVGSAVGKIGKILGCRTVGVAGGPEKVAQCRDLFGYDAAIDYKRGESTKRSRLLAPMGFTSISIIPRARSATRSILTSRFGARVVVCGTASISSWDPWPMGPRIERHLLAKRAQAQGFVIFDHMDRYETSVARLADWVRSGQLRYQEDILEGLESCPDALAGLYRGENKGKRLIRL